MTPWRLACSFLVLGLGATAAAEASPVEGHFPGEGAALHYELDLPSGPGPYPAVVMGHGSGRSTKHQTRFLVPFWLERGLAVLRSTSRSVR